MTIFPTGKLMKVRITYRRTSRLSMRVGKNGDLLVSAPYFTPSSAIRSFIEKNRDWIEKAVSGRQEAQARQNAGFDLLPLRTAGEKQAAKARLDAIIAPLVARYASEMGVTPGEIHYHASRTRWGSCNIVSRNINFSLYLLLLPLPCIEHTVVHELAHLLVPDHSPAFRAVMDRFYPDWKNAKKLARETMSR